MYNFIFYFIYKSQVNQKSGGPIVARYIGSLIVFLAILIHVGFIYSIVRFSLFRIVSNSIAFSLGKTYGEKLILLLPLFIPIILLVYKYFNNDKIDKLVKKYDEQENFYSYLSIFKFIFIIVVPLIIAIVLVNETIT